MRDIGRSFAIKPFLILLFMMTSIASADEYKALFDCSSGDSHYIKSRMWLIDKTMTMIEERGDRADFVLTLHGSCVAMVSKNYDFIVDDSDMKNIEQAQNYLKNLSEKRGVKVIACAMSLAANAIDKEEVIESVEISPNSFIDAISYQNSGYALMTFK